ncbi:Dual specificity protein phosphatase 14 [Fasciola hepatica]|uniref:Dual specificity protein phosphatase 14 n=1 Tax=Fasciola hepatica TaxID=6192 RepID=A0A2H1BV50_FASHE|nr:Dual specificity protein phosphatase 14 [Fasciola hepatica]
MSVTRAHGDRGPPEGHMLDRFSTTYSTSYRPYEESRRTVPIQCVPSSKSVSVPDTSTLVSRASRFWPINTESGGSHAANVTVRSNDVAHTTPPYQPSISRVLNPIHRTKTENSVGVGMGTRRSWDDTALATSTGLGSADRPLPRPPCLSGTNPSVYRPIAAVGAVDLNNSTVLSSTTSTNGNKDSNTRNYASTYTTVVSDKLTPCFAISNGGANTKATTALKTEKPVSGFCTTSSRPSVVASSGASCTDLGVNKLSLNSSISPPLSLTPSNLTSGPFSVPIASNPTYTERPVSLTTVAPYQPVTHFDFGQMFSQIARINDHLYLSSLNALTPDRLRQHGITLLISAMVDPVPTHLRNSVSSSVHVPVEDMEGANLRSHFDRIADRIAAEHRRGGRTLVHCMAGVSRSSSLILAYLIRHLNMSLAEAYQHVRGIRPCIQPNPGFWRQLLDYEERLRGTRSVRLLPPLGYSGTCSVSPTGNSRLFCAATRHTPRSTYLDMFTRNSGDLLPYRPLTTLHSIDSSKPYVGCRQPLG